MQGDFRIEGWLAQPQLNQLVGPAGPVKVQPRSMAVLVLLAGQPGEVLSRQTLLEAAWEGAFVTEEVLTSCIWDLRRALGDDPQKPRFIQTIPRRGYRLIAPVSSAKEGAEDAAAPPAPAPARGPDERNRRVLLDKVAAFWVDQVLARALAAVPALTVGRQLEWTAVADPRQGRGALDGLEARPIPAGKGIGEIFDETGRALLILGEPGAGKTVALLELAAAAVARARASAVEPVPVVLHLASWSARRGALADWAVEELGLRYQVPRAVAREWLGRDALLLLLDGLDEVAPASQAACVEAIDRFRDRQGMTAIAVACRSDAHAALPRLRLGGAIRLLPLTPATIEAFLRATPLPPGEGAELERSLALDPALGELVRTPLLLRLLCQSAESGRGATPATAAEEGGDPAGARRRRLLAAFVERALADRPEGGEPLYPRAVTGRRLSWLAREMLTESQPLFHVERLQPGWLPPAGFRAAYWLLSRLAVAVPIALLAAPVPPADVAGRALYALGGAAVGALAAWLAARAAQSGGRAVDALPALALGLAAGLLFYALSLPRLGLPLAQRPGVYFGLVFGVLFGLRRDRHGPAGDIAATEGLGWSWRRTARGAGGGLLLGLLARGALALTGAPPGAGPGGGRAVPLLGLGLFFAAALGVLFGFEGRKVEATSRPNRGIHLALRNALLGGALFGGVCAALETALVGGSAARSPFLPAGAPPPTPSLPFALLGMGLFGFFWFGGLDAVKHYTLRLLLAASGRMPLRLIPFLDFAAARDLLQKAGGGYLFLHRSLLDHFAAEPETLTSPDSR